MFEMTEDLQQRIIRLFGRIDCITIIDALQTNREHIISCILSDNKNFNITFSSDNPEPFINQFCFMLNNCAYYRFRTSNVNANSMQIISRDIPDPNMTRQILVPSFTADELNEMLVPPLTGSQTLPTLQEYVAALAPDDRKALITTAKELGNNPCECIISHNDIEKNKHIVVSLAKGSSTDKKAIWLLRIYDGSVEANDNSNAKKVKEYLEKTLKKDPLTRAPFEVQPAIFSNFGELISLLNFEPKTEKETYCGFKPGFLTKTKKGPQ